MGNPHRNRLILSQGRASSLKEQLAKLTSPGLGIGEFVMFGKYVLSEVSSPKTVVRQRLVRTCRPHSRILNLGFEADD